MEAILARLIFLPEEGLFVSMICMEVFMLLGCLQGNVIFQSFFFVVWISLQRETI